MEDKTSAGTVKDDTEMTNGQMVSVGFLHEKLKEQQELMSMMQIQLDLQNERLAGHEKLIKDLSDQVKKLELESKDDNAVPTQGRDKNDWTTNAGSSVSVAELVKQAAEETLSQTSQPNYVYDETSGLYYDKNSGYYYDPAQELFYNGHTKTYYKYDAPTQTYVFHSQLTDSDVVPSRRKRKSKKSKDIKSHPTSPKPTSSDSNPCSPQRADEPCQGAAVEPEEGELPDTPVESEESESDGSLSETDTIVSHTTTDSEQREKYIPCIRAVIVESSIPSLPKGFLFLVTCMGGSIGREGSMHSILIPDPTISKHHADIHYSNEDGKYYLTDLGSQSGTFLNGKRLSDAKVKSETQEVLHGSTLKVGETTLLLHIHPGTFTCGHCEPGLIPKEPLYGLPLSKNKKTKEELRKQQLKKLRKKYGVEQYATDGLGKLPDSYKDRAAERRVVKGSDNPFEKTQVASINEPIKEDNKGFKMMAKMGWNSGTSLGRPNVQSSTSGILEPIKIEIRTNRVGLGSQTGTMSYPNEDLTTTSTQPRLKGHKKQDRAQMVEKTLKRFRDCDKEKGAQLKEEQVDTG